MMGKYIPESQKFLTKVPNAEKTIQVGRVFNDGDRDGMNELIEKKLDKITFVGNEQLGIKGLFNNSDVTVHKFGGIAMIEGVSRLRGVITNIISKIDTNKPNVMVIPSKLYSVLLTTPEYTEKTYLETLQEKLLNTLGITLKTSDLLDGSDLFRRIVFYNDDPSCINYDSDIEITNDHGINLYTGYIASHSGVNIIDKTSIFYLNIK